MPRKPARYGIKVYISADSATAYCHNAEVYIGRRDNDPPAGAIRGVVERLVHPLRHTGRNITSDRHFTSIPLADSLMRNNLTLLGTIAPNKAQIPAEMSKNRRHPPGTAMFGFSGYKTLLFYVPRRSKAVHMLSTTHHTGDVSADPPNKQVMITD